MHTLKRTIDGEEKYIVMIKAIWSIKDFYEEGSDDLLLGYIDGKLAIIRDAYTWDADHPDDVYIRTEVLHVITDANLNTDYEQIIKDFKHHENELRLKEVRREIEKKKAEEKDLLQLLGITK